MRPSLGLMFLRNKWKTVLFMAGLVFAGMAIPPRIAVTMTPSLDKRIFFIKEKNPTEVRKSDYVLFTCDFSRVDPEFPTVAIKRVACTAGEILRTQGNVYFCEGESIGMAKDVSLGGERVAKFVYDGVIPEGYIFVAGDHRDSYDSKYFGFLRKRDVQAIVYPLF